MINKITLTIIVIVHFIFLLHSKQNVSLHVNNIFREDELVESSVVKDSLTTELSLIFM